jgi:hypothetical protein
MTLRDFQSNDIVDLEAVVNPRDSSTRKELPPVNGTPDTIGRYFNWKSETVMSAFRFAPQVEHFTTHHKELGLDSQKILGRLKKESSNSSNDFAMIYRSQRLRPGYHNETHVSLTAAQGTKLFLGGLSELYESNQNFKSFADNNPGKLQQLTEIALFILTRHEQDDWWNRRSIEDQQKRPIDKVWELSQQQARVHVLASCRELGITPEEFNYLLTLDTFATPLAQSVENVVNGTPLQDSFFSNTVSKPTFEWLGSDKEVHEMFFTLLGKTARAADFMQIFNPNYYRRALIFTDDSPVGGVLSNVGSVALAYEFHQFRPQAAKLFGWLKEDGSINWNAIGVGKKFLRDFALPNIELGVGYLKRFNTVEGGHVEEIVAALKEAVA